MIGKFGRFLSGTVRGRLLSGVAAVPAASESHLANRRHVENTLRFIAQLGWTDKSDSFLTSLAQYVGESLGVDYVVIDRLTETPGVAETVALYANGGIVPNIRYALKGTPCENVVGKRLCYYPHGVQALFPEDTLLVEMGVESYAGIPLWDQSGKGIGLIAVMDGKPLREEEAVTQLLQLVAVSAAAFLEREKRDLLLRQREQEFRTLANNIPDLIVRYDHNLCRTFVNRAWEEASGLSAAEVVNVPAADIPVVPSPVVEGYMEKIRRVLADGTPEKAEFSWENARGEILFLEYLIVPEYDPEGKIAGVLSVGRDITERHRVEEERQANLWYFESMDRINRALHGATDLAGMLNEVLDLILTIFACDRAYLLYPCDPEAGSWSVPVERTRPEFPGALALGREIPMGRDVADKLRLLLDSAAPVKFGPGTGNPLPAEIAERFGIQCLMAMSIHPKVGQPWEFGIHQCTHVRHWTSAEERLFENIGRRLADGLTSLQAYRDLLDTMKKLEEAQRIAHIGYWDRDIAANRVSLASEACRIFGISEQESVFDLEQWHQRWLTLIHPEDRQRTGEAVREALQGGRRYNMEYRIIRPDGEIRHIHSEANVFRDGAGKPVRMLGMMQDITDRKRTEEELKQHRDHLEDLIRERTEQLSVAKEQAEAANQAKSDFLANMSHELRTPLNAILGYAQILQRANELAPKQAEAVRTIHDSGRHLLNLINEVLDIAKIEARRIELHLTDFELSAFLWDIAGIVAPKAEAKGVRFRFDPGAPNPLAVHGDEVRLRQMIINLLDNAIKFTREGEVAFRVILIDRPAAGEEEGAAVSPEPLHLRFEVSDTGVGIPPEQMERIFLPFERGGADKYSVEGTGLGLAICTALAREMGSRIQVRSEPGKGSAFWFDLALPAAAEEFRHEIGPREAIAGYEGAPRKVLVADDREYNRQVLVNMLAPLGFEISEAGNGQEAVNQALTIRPDLILMDLRMPVMSGPEAVRHLRETPDFKDTVIIAVSASAFDQDVQESLLAGCDGFLGKPIEMARLLDMIGRFLHLQWIFRGESATGEAPEQPVIVLPPRGELQSLHQLALMGSMARIRDWAVRLQETDVNYRPFAEMILKLAKGFQTRAILAIVERHLEGIDGEHRTG